MIATLPLLLLLAQSPGEPQLESRAQALSPDEKLLAFAVSDGSIHVVELPAGKERWRVAEHPHSSEAEASNGYGDAVAWSPDSSQIATLTANGNLSVLRATDGEPVHGVSGTHVLAQFYLGPPSSWDTVHFLGGGKRLLVVGPCAELIDAGSGAVIHEYQWQVSTCAVSRDSLHFALGDTNGVFAVYSGETGALEAGPVWLPGTINALAFDAGAERLAVGAGDCKVRVFKLPIEASPLELSHQDQAWFWGEGVGSVEFARDGKTLLSSTTGNWEVRCWDLERAGLRWSYDYGGGNEGSMPAGFAKDASIAILSAYGYVIDSKSGKLLRTLQDRFAGSDFRIAGDFAWSSAAGKITLVDPSAGKLVCEIPLKPAPPPPPLKSTKQSLSSDQRLFAFAVSDGTVHIVTLPEGKPSIVVSGFPREAEGLAFSPDGTLLACLAANGEIRIIACADGKLVSEFAGSPVSYPSWVTSRTIEFVDEGTKLFLAGGVSGARLIERDGGRVVHEFSLGPRGGTNEGTQITASAVSPDMHHLALGDSGGRFAVYSAKTGALEVGPFHGPPWVRSLEFDRRSERLAVGSDSCRASVIPLWAGGDSLVLSHEDQDLGGDLAIGSVHFSPDGRTLLASSFTWWEVRLWDLEHSTEIWRHDYGGGIELSMDARFANDPRLVIGSPAGTVFDAGTGELLHTLGQKFGGEVFAGTYRMAGDYAWVCRSGAIKIIEPREARLVCELPLAAK